MGKHSAPRGMGRPQEIDHLTPASDSIETPKEAARRQREVRQSPAEMARKRQRTRRVMFGCLGVLVLLVAVGAIAAYAYVRSVDAQIHDKGEHENPGVAAKLVKEAPVHTPGDPFYMLLIGKDQRPGELTANSDTLIVARVDPPQHRVTLLSIPRDTRVEIPGHGYKKINAAMQLGGTSMAVDTVHKFTGLPISHYMEVDFNGFRDLVEAIGGVWVNVPRNIDDIKAANHHEWARVVHKGYQKLDGDHALTFVRSRNMLGDDWVRIKDQQVFLKALAKQTLDAKNVLRFNAIVQAMMHCVTTDMSVADIFDLSRDFQGKGDQALQAVTAPGEAKYINGISYVISDEAGLAEIIAKLKAGESFDKNKPSTSADSSASSTPAVKAVDVDVDVRNGAGVKGLAAEVSQVLTGKSFHVTAVGNTARPVYDKTLIVFAGDNDAKAKLVHDTLGFGQVYRNTGIYAFKTDVLVIVGKDWRTQFPQATAAN